MNINLIYQKKAFNFDLREDTSIKYLENLSSKLISKDKSNFTLVYKNNDLSKNPESLLKDLINTEETNIPIEISLKNNTKSNTKKILPKINLSKDYKVFSKEKYNKGKILLNKTEIYNIPNKDYSIKELQENSKQNYSSDKYRMNRNDKIIKNEIFESLYNNKEKEILSLMNNLSQIIKEYDSILYKKQKSEMKNKELLLFEKNVLEFKNNQIKILQKLVNYFDKKESNYLRGNIDLDDFYLDLKFSFLNDDSQKKDKEKEFPPTSLNNRNKNKYNNISSSLPVLTRNIEINPKNKLFSSKEQLEKNSIKSNKTLKEKKEVDNLLFKSEKKNIKDKNSNKSSYLFKNQENIQNKNYLGKNVLDNDESDKSQSENSTLSKPQNICHTIIPKNIINEINNDSKGINNIAINKNNNSDEEDDENIEHIKVLNRQNNPMKYNKIDTLFEISELQNNNNEKNDSSQSDKSSLENNKKEDDNFEDKKNYSRKSINVFVKNNKLGFMIRDRRRKTTKRAKKLGINENDFLI